MILHKFQQIFGAFFLKGKNDEGVQHFFCGREDIFDLRGYDLVDVAV